MEFRWEIERFFLLPSGFLTTINLSVRAINIKFPPITVSLSCKCSGQTVRKAEFMATLAGRGKGGFVWSPNNLLWFKKKPLRTCRTKSNFKIHGIIFLPYLNLLSHFDFSLFQMRQIPSENFIFHAGCFLSNFVLEYDGQICCLRQALGEGRGQEEVARVL